MSPLHRPAGPPALIAVAHGSRDPRAVPTVTALLDRVRALRPGLTVRLGHIELNEPLLTDTLDALPDGSDAVLVPLLFAPGHHVTHDLPQAAAAAAPRIRARVAAPLGAHPLVVDALRDRLTEAGWRPPPAAGGVVLAAAGSRHPGSAAVTRRLAARLSLRLDGVPVLAAYASAAAPTVPEAVRELAARGRTDIAVASCFTAPGLFATRSAAAAPGPAAAPIGPHPALARLVLRRYDEAAGRATAPVPEAYASA
ncbi:sirohydrochlorin chelatase [Streptomyces sp. CC228A]|uniref:sirohydrochlorin chelatase n=1 Tax=Streptomyces sp. CC228A TaxID=2898186 RepID=UPI001F269565|nr:sirohydrochlorin chelatase [Streptomyces sp. CC228A]